MTLYVLAPPRLLYLIDHIKISYSFKNGYDNGRWVALYAHVSPQLPHAWSCGRVRKILLPATKLWPCVNNTFDVISLTVQQSWKSECVQWSRGLHRLYNVYMLCVLGHVGACVCECWVCVSSNALVPPRKMNISIFIFNEYHRFVHLCVPLHQSFAFRPLHATNKNPVCKMSGLAQ